jgi:D-alanine--poly(phosphoribitol) ligase subunit 1
MLSRIRCSAEALGLHQENNNTATPYQPLTISELFEQQVRLRPDSIAVMHGAEFLTYRDLDGLANGLAYQLRECGVEPRHVVGVSFDRSFELIIALLAVSKCGATYLPFDMAWPQDVVAGVLRRCGSRHVLVRSGSRSSVPATTDTVIEFERATVRPAAGNHRSVASPDDVAYISFTSGTTGLSKGVQISHRSIGRLVLNARYAELGPGASVLHTSPAAFDAATFEIWGPLLTGGTCVLYPGRTVSISGLRSALREGDVNCVFLTTALFNITVEDAPGILDRVELAYKRYGPGRLVHMYGPTECTTFATYFVINEMPSPISPLPIGGPIQNTRVYVVRDDVLCAAGEIGEILLAGPGLSVGYIGDDAMTQTSFEELEIAGARERIYRTGDYGYLLQSGELVFDGRIDDQVKINGFRIELSEVSRVIAGHPKVTQTYLTVSDGPAGERLMLAFVVASDGEADANEIRQYVAARLPKYMVPAVVYYCESLPLLSTGKVDRRALIRRHNKARDTN